MATFATNHAPLPDFLVRARDREPRITPKRATDAGSAGAGRLADRRVEGWRRIAVVFLPFAMGCYLTFLFRSINGLISGQLKSDTGLGAADLGLVTSVYFLILAAAQIPIGSLLDRFGPRRVQGSLFLVAALGA